MTIATILIILSTIIYALACVAFFVSGDRPLGVVYLGYTLANVGVIWLTVRPL